MTTTNEAPTAEPEYEQLQLPGIDWSQYEHREIPTDQQIIDSLPEDEYYEAFADVLLEQYSLTVKPAALKLADAFTRKRVMYDRIAAAAKAKREAADA